MKIERVLINTDGASRGNPGAAAIGATIKDGQGKLITQLSRPIGRATNNQAEYRAVIAALEEAIRLGAREVNIRMDSELVVRQLNGRYRVKNPALRSLHQEVERLRQQLEVFDVSHVPRGQNREADRLANMALNRLLSRPAVE